MLFNYGIRAKEGKDISKSKDHINKQKSTSQLRQN